jgi:predicted Rossmann-fold nucleotide-binding protein
MCYAGIGNRKTPPEGQRLAVRVGRRLAELGWILRTGGAPGADQAFLQGARAGRGRVELFLPWPRYEGFGPEPGVYPAPVPEAFALAAEIHPVWERLSQTVRTLHARNVHQILGPSLVRILGKTRRGFTRSRMAVLGYSRTP